MSESEIEFRAAEVQDVNFPRRTIDLIVMPYEREGDASYRGRQITEIVSRGAFGRIQDRARKIPVNRGHRIDAVVGKTVALHPDRHEGLVAEVRISRTDLGEETLILADDGILDASAGFGLLRSNGRTGPVVANAERWEGRNRRRLNHLFLDHIAMTPDPAYPDAQVLAVRARDPIVETAAVTATPNLAMLEVERLRAQMALIDRRYAV